MEEPQFNIISALQAAASDETLPSGEESTSPEALSSLDENLNTLRSTNWDILNYFRSTYISQSEQIQGLKSELFELDVKLEELQKTRDLYSFPSDNRQNIFSPIVSNPSAKGKGQIIQAQLDELKEVRASLSTRIQKLDTGLAEIRHHIDALEKSNQCLASLYQNLPQTDLKEPELTLEEAISPEQSSDEALPHAISLLMLHHYDQTQIAEQLRGSVQQNLETNQNKLEILKWLIQSDPNRARLTLQELQDTNQRLLFTTEALIHGLDKDLAHQKPIWMAIDDCIEHYRSLHPECVMDASVDCTDYEINVLPIITIIFVQLLHEILDNVFYYSNANKIMVKIYINNRMLDAYINDNGVGIPSDYLTASPWHSGLHRLHEVIHLLDGKLQIDGDIISGTNIRFSFPIRANTSADSTSALEPAKNRL